MFTLSVAMVSFGILDNRAEGEDDFNKLFFPSLAQRNGKYLFVFRGMGGFFGFLFFLGFFVEHILDYLDNIMSLDFEFIALY